MANEIKLSLVVQDEATGPVVKFVTATREGMATVATSATSARTALDGVSASTSEAAAAAQVYQASARASAGAAEAMALGLASSASALDVLQGEYVALANATDASLARIGDAILAGVAASEAGLASLGEAITAVASAEPEFVAATGGMATALEEIAALSVGVSSASAGAADSVTETSGQLAAAVGTQLTALESARESLAAYALAFADTPSAIAPLLAAQEAVDRALVRGQMALSNYAVDAEALAVPMAKAAGEMASFAQTAQVSTAEAINAALGMARLGEAIVVTAEQGASSLGVLQAALSGTDQEIEMTSGLVRAMAQSMSALVGVQTEAGSSLAVLGAALDSAGVAGRGAAVSIEATQGAVAGISGVVGDGAAAWDAYAEAVGIAYVESLSSATGMVASVDATSAAMAGLVDVEALQVAAAEAVAVALQKVKDGAVDASLAIQEASAAVAAALEAEGTTASVIAAAVEADYRVMIEAALKYQDAVTASAPEIMATMAAFTPIAAEVSASYAGMADAARSYAAAATESATTAQGGLARLGESIMLVASANLEQAASAEAAAAAQGSAAGTTSALTSALGGMAGAAKIGANAVRELVDFTKDVVKYATLATAAIDFLTVHYAKQAVELSNLGRLYGMTNAEIAGLAAIAGKAGIPVESLREGMVQFEKALAGVGDGAKRSALVLDALGISLTTESGKAKNAHEVLLELADVFERLPDGEAKTAAAAALGGEAFAKLVPILSQGRDAFVAQEAAAQKYGTALTDLQVLVAKDVVSAFGDAKMAVQGLGFAIETEAGPAVAEMLKDFAGWIAANRTLISQNVAAFVRGIGEALREAAPYVIKVAEWLGKIGEELRGFPNLSGSASTFDELNASAAQLSTRMEVLAVNMKLPGQSADSAADDYAHLQSALAAVNRKISESIAASQASQASMHELKDATFETAEATTQAGESTSAYDEMLRKLEEALKHSTSGMSDAEKAAKKAAQTNAELADSLERLNFQKLDQDIADYTEALEASRDVVADGSYLAALDAIIAKLDEQTEASKRAAEAAIAAGGDSSLAWQVANAEIAQATREANDAIGGLNETLVENAGYWDDLGKSILELPPEMRAFIPTLNDVAAATGNVDEATFGLTESVEEMSEAGQAASGVISDLTKSIIGLIDGTTTGADVMKSFAGSLVDGLGSTLAGAVKSSDLGKQLGGALEGVLGPEIAKSVGGAIATAGASAAVQLGAAVFIDGVKNVMGDKVATGAAEIGLLVGGPIGAAIGYAIGSQFGPSMEQRITQQFVRMIKGALGDPEIVTALNAGLAPLGLEMQEGLALILKQSPKKAGADVGEAYAALGKDLSGQLSEGFAQDMKKHGAQLIHSSVQDITQVFFDGLDQAAQVGLGQAVEAAGAAIAQFEGYVGNKAIAAANAFGLAILDLAYQLGWTAQQTQDFANKVAVSLGGMAQSGIAALDQLNADAMEALGPSGFQGQLDLLNETLTKMTGKKVKAGNLTDALEASGLDVNTFITLLDNLGFHIDALDADFAELALAAANGAGDAIRSASADMESFGNTADGTAQILEQKVVTALGDVVKNAEMLSYSESSIQALGAAAASISPELLRSDAVVQALHDSFAQMAVGAHMSIRDLVDSIDPPLPAAVRAAILSVDALGEAIGALAGAPLHTIKEVADRIVQFAGQMYETIVDENGKATQQLTNFGEQLVSDMVSAIGGMWNTINEDSWVGLDEIAQVFDQLAALPAEALNDPAIQDAMKGLIAKIAEATGDAALVAMANADTITQEMLDQAMASYDEYKAHVDNNPIEPTVQPTTSTDGSAGATPTGPDTSDATSAPPPAPVPKETLDSWTTISTAAKEYATAIGDGNAAIDALAKATQLDAATILAAIQPIIGTVDDEQSLNAIGQKFVEIKDYLDVEATQAFEDWSTASILAVSAVFEHVGELQSALNALASGNYDIHQTITTEYVTINEPPTGAPKPGGSSDGTSGEGDGTNAGDSATARAAQATSLTFTAPTSPTTSGSTTRGASPPAASSASAQGAANLARAVANELTQGGRLHVLIVPELDAQKFANGVILTGVDKASREGSLTGARMRRNPAWPS